LVIGFFLSRPRGGRCGEMGLLLLTVRCTWEAILDLSGIDFLLDQHVNHSDMMTLTVGTAEVPDRKPLQSV
jgi:hypothetical protein